VDIWEVQWLFNVVSVSYVFVGNVCCVFCGDVRLWLGCSIW
jgi:hypothetical protein